MNATLAPSRAHLGLTALLLIAACPGTGASQSDSGIAGDGGLDSGLPIVCGLKDGTGCTRAAGGNGVCCDGVCVDTGNDAANCDGCGQVCPGPALCHSSTCQLAGQTQADCLDGGCAAGLACAGGYYCGTLSCPAGEVGGLCALAPDSGEPASNKGTCCSGACADLLFDAFNCGACGRSCADGGFCRRGLCVANPDCSHTLAGTDCRLTATRVGGCCGPACVDLASDPQACGACGEACPLDQACAAGLCSLADGGESACSDGGELCPPQTACTGRGCLTDSCPATGLGSLCAVSLAGVPVAGLCCDGGCVDVAVDPSNCGGCGVSCGSGICDGGCLPSAPDAGPQDAG